jgi:hypothetical protein
MPGPPSRRTPGARRRRLHQVLARRLLEPVHRDLQFRRREIKKAEQLAASIAESLGARPPVLLDTPSSARAENHADSAS